MVYKQKETEGLVATQIYKINQTNVKGAKNPQREHQSPNIDYMADCFGFSYRFFSSGITEFLSKFGINKLELQRQGLSCIGDNIIEDALNAFAVVFKDIASAPIIDYNVAEIVESPFASDALYNDENKFRVYSDRGLTAIENLGIAVYKIIMLYYGSILGKADVPEILLWLRGPIGSYKNRLLQYVFLYVLKKLEYNIVFYIDLSKYESDSFDCNADIERIKKILDKEAENEKPPLFIFDNVREFYCGINGDGGVYEKYNNFLNSIGKYKLIIGSDSLYSFNKMRVPVFFEPSNIGTAEVLNVRDAINAVSGGLPVRNVINIASMNLNREKESIEFIINCSMIDSNIECYDKEKAEKLREKLIKLDFYTLDAYWLIKLLKEAKVGDYTYDSILSIYDEKLFPYGRYNMNKHDWDELAERAYKSEYDGNNFDASQFYNPCWLPAREHRSVMDYLIARCYVIKFRSVINRGDLVGIGAELLNVVFPKSINRFILPQLTDNDLFCLNLFLRDNIIEVIRFHNFICQISYLIGAVKDKNYFGFVETMKMLGDALDKIYAKPADIINDLFEYREMYLRNYAFVNRCISMCLGRLGATKFFQIYLAKLIPDNGDTYSNDMFKTFDDVNRAFHLDYYGDTIVSMAVSSGFSCYTDNYKKGFNAFRKLSSDVTHKLKHYYKKNDEGFICKPDAGDENILYLQLYTFCRLMQVREYRFENPSNSENFLKTLYDALNDVLNQGKITAWLSRNSSFIKTSDSTKIENYFRSVRDDIRKVFEK